MSEYEVVERKATVQPVYDMYCVLVGQVAEQSWWQAYRELEPVRELLTAHYVETEHE